ncbi:hypothetical protein EZS27_004405 [termite gut metagenome]|uniref:Type I-B CRISPR-associated protein Cas8b1/Cst1 n=1 Tax=termite gut metagenome TaxID=433724 RepID=A0A5J4SRT6_9ZZZZ
MERQFATIDYNWLITPTGDPFADVGGFVIKELEERFPDKDILELIEYVTKIYVDKWEAKLNPFFLNSKITQPAFDAKKKVEETMRYFQSLIDETDCKGIGVCRITGQQTKLSIAGRDNSVLSGSGTFVNFHHTFEGGIMVSKEALIRFHFLPFGCMYLQGKIALIHSYDEYYTEYFARTNCKSNLAAIGKNTSTGILQSECKSPGTALFRFIDTATMDYKRKGGTKKKGSLTLYHFSNFGASPEVTVHSVPNQLFRFYHFTQGPEVKSDWNSFIAGYYVNSEYKSAKYNEETDHIDFEKKGVVTTIPESDYKNWTNIIYNKLLNGQSILNDMLNRSKKNKFDFLIVQTYQIHLRNMKKETISKINEMTEFIFSANKDEAGIEKAIKKLNNAQNPYLLRRFIIKDIIVKNYNKENPNTIVTVEEYANYLFPDTSLWREIRDVLLIAIYQKLHEKNLKINSDLDLNDDEENG